MKTILAAAALFSLVASTLATANTVSAPKLNSNEVLGYVPAQLLAVSLSPLCPQGAVCVVGGTMAELTFEIPCAGGLVEPINSFVVTKKSGQATVYVQATGIVTERSIRSFCAPGSSKTVTISLPNLFPSESDFVDLNAK
jgi:hypothetical protein